MRRVWNWLVIARVLGITEQTMDTTDDVDEMRKNFQQTPLHVAQALHFALLPYSVLLPETDSQLLAASRQYRAPHSPEEPRMPGTILLLADGRLGMALDQTRVIESTGSALAIVDTPEPGRYVEAWEVPGVVYLGGI